MLKNNIKSLLFSVLRNNQNKILLIISFIVVSLISGYIGFNLRSIIPYEYQTNALVITK